MFREARELERIEKPGRIERIWDDGNGCYHHQIKYDGEDFWRTDYTSFCCITVHRPYPYTAPSYYYLRRRLGWSVEEALK